MTPVTISLDTPIVRGDTTIATLQLRKPGAGELRGVNLLDVAQLQTTAIIKVLPRITTPTLTEPEVAAMDLGDFMACAAEVAGFLLQKAQIADFPEA